MKKVIVKITVAAVLTFGFFGLVDGQQNSTSTKNVQMKVIDPGDGGR